MRRTTLAALAVGALGATAIGTAVPATAAPATPGQPGAGVVALWHLDEQPGATVMVDASGFGHHGLINADVTVGVPGFDNATAYEFDGPAPIVRVPHHAGLNPGRQPLTISAYLRVPADLTQGDYNVLQKGTATATGGAYKLEIFGQLRSPKFGYPDCALNSSSGHNRVYGPRRINDGAWHRVECHLTDTQAFVTVDGISGPPAPRQVANIANTIDLTFGGKPTNTHFYSGRADEVSITIG